MIHNTKLTDEGKIERALQLINFTYYLGIGKDTEWNSLWGDSVNDLNPPVPTGKLNLNNEMLFYKRPFYKTLAVESQCGSVEFSTCGESLSTNKKVTLINLETTNLETLKVIVPDYLYFRIDITEEDLTFFNVNNFRIASLYRGTTFTSEGFVRYSRQQVNNPGTSYWVDYFTPIYKDTILNKTSIFEILIKI